MAKASPHSLTAKERLLVADTEASSLRALDEDALINLHLRVRRARDKYVQLHRRGVGQQVEATRARGEASTPPRRSASKAEIFEAALGRVSAHLARAARANAAALRAERLAASRRPSSPSTPTTSEVAPPRSPVPRARAKAPVERRAVASTRAAGRRREAARDGSARPE
jgi:hypothetical protein